MGLFFAISFGLAPDRVTSRQRALSPVGFGFSAIRWVLLRACMNARCVRYRLRWDLLRQYLGTLPMFTAICLNNLSVVSLSLWRWKNATAEKCL